MAYLLDKGEECPSREMWRWSWRIFKRKRRSSLPIPKKKGRMIKAFLLSSVKSCESGHGLRHHLLELRRTARLVLRRRG